MTTKIKKQCPECKNKNIKHIEKRWFKCDLCNYLFWLPYKNKKKYGDRYIK